jgi:hypothetical protein
MKSIRKQFALFKLILWIYCRLIYRTCTQKMRVLPDFFVIGPPRSGTSSLYYYIDQHPSYVRPFMKELGYSVDPQAKSAPHPQFDHDIYQHLPAMLRKPLMWTAQGLFYHNGANGYRKLFPLASNMEKTVQRYGSAITGEFTVFGLYGAAAANGFPYCLTDDGTKFITILRDPVDFLFSFYTLETNTHFRQVNRDVSFDQFIHHPEDLYVDDRFIRSLDMNLQQWRPHFEQYSFFDESRYSFATFMVSYVVFIKHWARKLPRERFLVLSFTDLCEHSRETMNTVFDFLELPSFEVPDVKPVNANVYTEKAIPQETASYIRAVSRPYNEELYEFLGRDLGWE